MSVECCFGVWCVAELVFGYLYGCVCEVVWVCVVVCLFVCCECWYFEVVVDFELCWVEIVVDVFVCWEEWVEVCVGVEGDGCVWLCVWVVWSGVVFAGVFFVLSFPVLFEFLVVNEFFAASCAFLCHCWCL